MKKYGEDCKIAIRNVRRELNDKIKAMEKKNEISEDDGRKAHDQIQKTTDKFVQEVEKVTEIKEKDLMDV